VELLSSPGIDVSAIAVDIPLDFWVGLTREELLSLPEDARAMCLHEIRGAERSGLVATSGTAAAGRALTGPERRRSASEASAPSHVAAETGVVAPEEEMGSEIRLRWENDEGGDEGEDSEDDEGEESEEEDFDETEDDDSDLDDEEVMADEEPRLPEPGEATCVVCAEAAAVATFVHGATGHTACCVRCAREVQRRGRSCPVCRRRFQAVIRNFNA